MLPPVPPVLLRQALERQLDKMAAADEEDVDDARRSEAAYQRRLAAVAAGR